LCIAVLGDRPYLSISLRVTASWRLSWGGDQRGVSIFFTCMQSMWCRLSTAKVDRVGHKCEDGGIYTSRAVFGDLSSGWRFQWWSEWPEQWRPLVELAAEMHAAFTAARGPNAGEGKRGHSE
jgi:hypothetical protein